MPIPRFRIRTLMIAVAAVAIPCVWIRMALDGNWVVPFAGLLGTVVIVGRARRRHSNLARPRT